MENCCVGSLTNQEERILNKKGQLSPRKRINKFLETFRNDAPVDIQRAVFFTESMKETEAYPMNIRWAKGIENVCKNIEVVIQEDELIVGTWRGGTPRHPASGTEGRMVFQGCDTRKKKAYRISDKDIEILEEKVIPYWKGKTAHERYLALMPQETRDIIYGDDDYGATGLMQISIPMWPSTCTELGRSTGKSLQGD